MDEKKDTEDLKTEIAGLKVRVRRLEQFLENFPNPEDYLSSQKWDTKDSGRDEFFDQAVRLVCQYKRASSSMLQRRLQIGFNRAARILEQLEEDKVVGPGDGSIPREVLVSDPEEFLNSLKETEKIPEK